MMEPWFAAFGLLALLYLVAVVVLPEVAEARAARLRAWAAATRVTYGVVRLGWKQHWDTYRVVKEVETR